MSFQCIEPGEFSMGQRGEEATEEPVHRVQMSRSFYLGTFPVTQAQFAVWTKAKNIPSHKNEFDGRPEHPAENMNWFLASGFCLWLTRTGQLPDGLVACLPTEAEWEYACRAGTDTEYYTGDGEAALGEAGWYRGNCRGLTDSVGQKEPNAWGLFDMHGNVLEWCHDAADDRAYCLRVDGVCDPGKAIRDADYADKRVFSWNNDSRRLQEPNRVLRGGCWFFDANYCRSAFRARRMPGIGDARHGFRVALVPNQAAEL